KDQALVRLPRDVDEGRFHAKRLSRGRCRRNTPKSDGHGRPPLAETANRVQAKSVSLSAIAVLIKRINGLAGADPGRGIHPVDVLEHCLDLLLGQAALGQANLFSV